MHLRRLRQALARYTLTDSVEQASSIAQLVAEGDAEAGHAGWRNAFETELMPILQRASDFLRLRESELYFRQNASPKTENEDAPPPSSDQQSRRGDEEESFAVVTRREIALLAVGHDELAKAHRRREVSPERYREIVLSATREMLTYFSQQESTSYAALRSQL
ncbi:hypothetical protein AB1Y20_004870 [Prymnesium parvum]|uniref:Uncharacterized protein n=1 Tax=Prymnesium parvum TaxID=97485 RepID=A0AB34J1H2_PRYPA